MQSAMRRLLLCVIQLTLFTLGPLVVLVPEAKASEAEDRLTDDLFDSYHLLSRPVQRHSDVLNVRLGIAISQIVEVEQKKERIILSMWMKINWIDYRLKWNESEYDGVEGIRVPPSKIWTPDIVLFNRVEEESSEGKEQSLIMVYSSGECFQYPFSIITAQCSIDVKWFPFDDQYCTLEYESWSYDSSKLNLSLQFQGREVDMIKPNCEWDIQAIQSEVGEKLYDCCKAPFNTVVFGLHLSRKVLYYAVNLILPCALISFLTPLSFLIPTEAGDRIGLGITILLAMSVYQIIILDKIPTSSEGIPLIGSYFIVLISMNAVAIIAMIGIVNLHQPSTKPMPKWARWASFNCLARLLRMSKPASSINTLNKESPLQDVNHSQPSADCAVKYKKKPVTSTGLERNQDPDNESPASNEETSLDLDKPPSPATIATLAQGPQFPKSGKDEEDFAEVIDDWKFTAVVMERACVVFFGAFQIICTFILLVFIFRNLASSTV